MRNLRNHDIAARWGCWKSSSGPLGRGKRAASRPASASVLLLRAYLPLRDSRNAPPVRPMPWPTCPMWLNTDGWVIDAG